MRTPVTFQKITDLILENESLKASLAASEERARRAEELAAAAMYVGNENNARAEEWRDDALFYFAHALEDIRGIYLSAVRRHLDQEEKK